ncbi:MAG: AraC family transcriptional regulator [Pseudomonadota bacterium]
MAADALSDVLRTIRLNGAAFFDVTVRAPWVLAAPSSDKCAPYVMPQAKHVIEYHVVTKGSCWGALVGGEPVRLETGDIMILAQGDAHVLSSDPGMHTEPDMSIYQAPDNMQLPIPLVAGSGDGEEAHIVCGFLGYDATRHPLLDALPRVIHAPAAERGPGNWLDAFIPAAVAECEARRPGGESILGRMSELMFVEVVRQYIESLPPAERGWLAGLRDRSVGRAINLMHGRPAHDWTLEEIAEEVGMSRSSLAERFSDYVGCPPMQYLANWRMQLATGFLSGGSNTIAEIAEKVGYESEAAFSRAFKRNIGIAPATWRKSQRLAIAAE